MSDFTLVRITWIDAHSVTAGWEPVAELDAEPCVVESVGYLLPDVKKGHITIAQSWIGSIEEVDHVLSVPTGMVTRLEHLTAHPVLPVEPAN